MTTALTTQAVPVTNNYQMPAITVSDIEKMAIAIASSKLFGVTTKEQAMSLMLIAQAEGTHPALAARDYHIIQGRPALKADAMMARFQQAGGRVEWRELTDERVCATFSHPSGGSVTIDWDMKRAKDAQIGGKDMWKKFPRQMLRARVISEGIRTVFPGVVIGVYTPEEVQDFEPQQVVQQQQQAKAETFQEQQAQIVDAEYKPEDTQRPHKNNYVVAAPIKIDGTLDYDVFAADLEAVMSTAETMQELSLYNRSNAKTLRQMEKDRPELFKHIGDLYRSLSQAFM